MEAKHMFLELVPDGTRVFLCITASAFRVASWYDVIVIIHLTGALSEQ
jgi:hypothetical protein